MHFYPRPPRGGRQSCISAGSSHREISIHALREEGDHGLQAGDVQVEISIHALREEGDPIKQEDDYAAGQFLSTPSARRATIKARKRLIKKLISIHALREEGDPAGVDA